MPSSCPKLSKTILDHIGNTPLVRINQVASELECEVLGKCEFFNAGGSIKDRIGKRMILDAEKSGRIKPGDTLIEPTSGNTGIGLAITALVRGYRMIITLPEKMSDEKMNMLKGLGAEIIRTPTEAAWDAPESHIGVAKKLQAAIPNSHILDQYANESNPLAHYEGTAEEIIYQCDGRLDMVVCGAGTGGTISGIARKLKERLPHVKVVGVDPIGSILAQPASLNTQGPSYLVEGIGYDFIPQVLDRSLVDQWIKTDDKASFTMARRLLKEEGLMVGGSSGAAMHACLRAASGLGRGQRVVVILPDATRNYMSKFLSDEWMVEKGLLESRSLVMKSPVASLLLDDTAAATAEWWKECTVVDLKLRAPITVSPTMACADAAAVMKIHSIDQLPVCDDVDGVVGVVTLGHLTSKIVSAHATPTDAVSTVMFRTFTQVPLSTPLSAFGRIFERNAYCLVVVPTRYHAPNAPHVLEKKVVLAVVTQFDLLEFVMKGPAVVTGSEAAPHVTSAAADDKALSPPFDGAQLTCAQLAWSFMKPPVSKPASKPPTSPPFTPRGAWMADSDQRGPDLSCSQLAWAFMKPSRASLPSRFHAGSLPSPYVESSSPPSAVPKMDLGLAHTKSLSSSEQASAAATTAASPCVEAAPALDAHMKPPQLALPASCGKEAA